MQNTTAIRTYSKPEEILSASFHGLGICFSIIGLVVLLVYASFFADAWAVSSAIIFGISMITLYSASTIYHAVGDLKKKIKLKKFDHIAIYYLIAGTYTPFMLVNIRGTLGWTIFGVIWGLAVLGTILKLATDANGKKLWSVSLYLLMGWLIIAAIKPMLASVPEKGLLFLAIGGLSYTLGVLFYVWKSKPYTHAIWHLFVLGGTVLHFFAVFYSIIPKTFFS